MQPEEYLKITVVTFATFGHTRKQRDYSFLVEKIRKSCSQLGLRLLVLSFPDGEGKADFWDIERALPMRKGAGYWSWKPQVILESLKLADTRYVLYLDSDLNILATPNISEIPEFSKNGVAVFKTNELLLDWTSKRCLKSFAIDEKSNFPIISASAVLIDRENLNAINFLIEWGRSIKDLNKLLDPFWSWRMFHRHDQSILSCLIATSAVRVSFFTPGFYQTGLNNKSLSANKAWLIHGETNTEILKHRFYRFRELESKIFHKYELCIYLLRNRLPKMSIFPIRKY